MAISCIEFRDGFNGEMIKFSLLLINWFFLMGVLNAQPFQQATRFDLINQQVNQLSMSGTDFTPESSRTGSPVSSATITLSPTSTNTMPFRPSLTPTSPFSFITNTQTTTPRPTLKITPSKTPKLTATVKVTPSAGKTFEFKVYQPEPSPTIETISVTARFQMGLNGFLITLVFGLALILLLILLQRRPN